MSEPSAFDAAWRVVKEDDDAFDVVPYANLKPSVPDYSREEAEIDILNSPFSEGLGWIDENGLTEAGKDVAAQYISDDKKQRSDPYMVHDDGRMPERNKKDPKAQMKHIERARRKVNEDPTE